MDTQSLRLQETWARPFLPTYCSVLCHGKHSLDAYLHGLFVAYHDRFRCLLGVPENPQDLNSIRAWKRNALTALAHLMLHVHTNHSVPISMSLPPIIPKDTQNSITMLTLSNIPGKNGWAAASSPNPPSNSRDTDNIVGEALTVPCSSSSDQVMEKPMLEPQCTQKVPAKSSVLCKRSRSSSPDSSMEELPPLKRFHLIAENIITPILVEKIFVRRVYLLSNNSCHKLSHQQIRLSMTPINKFLFKAEPYRQILLKSLPH
ncbi:hypothetical protein EDD18DRAFT_1108482 [Armillaria luteobubalina]|uniref:Uncharacterized protein n=1 Tax=Armillaria luteobubalina TaxID=153913 RepID=A0AA39PYN4_9AGAR|nr:hypothetical protein EDD18DRAFT_1108482 [Armillaria luteobubalina]